MGSKVDTVRLLEHFEPQLPKHLVASRQGRRLAF